MLFICKYSNKNYISIALISSIQTQVSVCQIFLICMWRSHSMALSVRETFFPGVYCESLVCHFPENFVYDSLAFGWGFRLWWSCLLTLQTAMNTSRNLSWWQYQFTQWHNDLVTRRPACQVHVWCVTNCVRTVQQQYPAYSQPLNHQHNELAL